MKQYNNDYYFWKLWWNMTMFGFSIEEKRIALKIAKAAKFNVSQVGT